MTDRVDEFQHPLLKLLMQIMLLQADSTSLGFAKTDQQHQKQYNVSAAAKRLLILKPDSIFLFVVVKDKSKLT